MVQEDEIIEEMIGTLVAAVPTKSGVSDKGVNWTLYKYTVVTRDGNRTLTGFVDPAKDNLFNQEVRITYTETPNTKYPSSPPFKNVKTMGLHVSEEHVKEANDKYHVKNIETPQTKQAASPTPYEQKMDELHSRKQDEILFGQVLNLTMEFILNERTIAAMTQSNIPTFDEKFDAVFDHIYSKALVKRNATLK